MMADSEPEPDLDAEPNRLSGPSVTGVLPLLAFPLQVDRFYASLMRHAPSVEAGLGGRLLYVGELDEDGRALMVGANIAGAASLAATADSIAGKQAVRDGVADFLVTDLDEALRILKNQIRKHEPVAVCVAAAPATIEQEMVERGVLPDLVRQFGVRIGSDGSLAFGGSPATVAPLALSRYESHLAWSVDEAPARWLPRLDTIALDCVGSDESPSAQIARRWLRFAPRYLGRLARNVRVLRCPAPTAREIAQRMRARVESGEIAVSPRIEVI
jgi:hypothetical protein